MIEPNACQPFAAISFRCAQRADGEHQAEGNISGML
jgi:hypothetical protein